MVFQQEILKGSTDDKTTHKKKRKKKTAVGEAIYNDGFLSSYLERNSPLRGASELNKGVIFLPFLHEI